MQTLKRSIKKDEKDIVAEQVMPADWSPAKRHQKDVEARWTKIHGKYYFGYKLSARADKRYKLIRKIKIRTASEHDRLHFDAVIDPSNTSRDILRRQRLRRRRARSAARGEGLRMRIQRKGNQDKPLSEVQQRRNLRIASPKARVKHVFAALAQLGGKTLRSTGPARATLHLNWKAAL